MEVFKIILCKKGWITYQTKYLPLRIVEVIIYIKKWETKYNNYVKPSWKIHCIFCRKVFVVHKKHSSTLIAIKVATKLVPYLFKPLFFKIAMKELKMCRCIKADVKRHWSSYLFTYLANCFLNARSYFYVKTHWHGSSKFLLRTFKSYKEKVLYVHLLKRCKPGRTLENNAAIPFSRKFRK